MMNAPHCLSTAARVRVLRIARCSVALAAFFCIASGASPTAQAQDAVQRESTSILEYNTAQELQKLTSSKDTAGALALIGKVFADLFLTVDRRPIEALRTTGATRIMVAFYGLLPITLDNLVSMGCYSFECAVRAAVIVGAVGGGGAVPRAARRNGVSRGTHIAAAGV